MSRDQGTSKEPDTTVCLKNKYTRKSALLPMKTNAKIQA